MQCAKCGTTRATTYKISPDGKRTLCEGCSDHEEAERIAEANKPSAAQLAKWAERDRIRKETEEEQDRAPRDPLFCKANSAHDDTPSRCGRPAVGLNPRGELVCSECAGELDPSKMLTRIHKLEDQMAAFLASKPAKGKAG